MLLKSKSDSTLTWKSPILLEDSSIMVLSVPSFDLSCFTPPPALKNYKNIVESNSVFNNQTEILSNKIKVSENTLSKKQSKMNMQSEIISKIFYCSTS